MLRKSMPQKFTPRRVIIATMSLLVLNLGFFVQPKILHAENSLYISQLQITGGSGHTAEDFVELFNPGSEPVNLKNLRLVKRTAQASQDSLIKSWIEDTLVPAHGFYLWANTAFSFAGVAVDARNTGALADDNGIALRSGPNDTGLILDSVAWGNTNNGFKNVSSQNPAARQALLRSNLYDAQSIFNIADSNPRNSQVVDAPIAVNPPLVNPPTAANPPATIAPPEVIGPIQSDAPLDPEIIPPAPTVPPDVPMLSDVPASSSGSAENTVSQCTAASTVSGSTDSTSPDSASTPNNSSTAAATDTAAWPSWSDNIKISEILADPIDEDSGNEAVEIENDDAQAASLENWLVDDASVANQPKTSAYSFPAITIPPSQAVVMIIPIHHFSLNNTGDTVNLYSPDGQLADTVSYDGRGKEGQTYQKVNGEWIWGSPSLGLINPIPLSPPPASALAPPASATSGSAAAASVSSGSATALASTTIKTSTATGKISAGARKISVKAPAADQPTASKFAVAKSSSMTVSGKAVQPSISDEAVPDQPEHTSELPTSLLDETAANPLADQPAASSRKRWWIYAFMAAAILGAGFIIYWHFINPNAEPVLEQ